MRLQLSKERSVISLKLYVLVKDDVKTVAISEYEEDIIDYISQNNLDLNDYSYSKIKDSKRAEKIFLNFDDVVLVRDHELDMLLTQTEFNMITNVINEEKSRILSTLRNLQHFIKYYRISKKSKKTLLEIHEILYSMRSFNKLKTAIKLDEFIGFMKGNKSFRDSVEKTNEILRVIIRTDNN